MILSATSATQHRNPLLIALSRVADTYFICNHLQHDNAIQANYLDQMFQMLQIKQNKNLF